MQPDRELRCKFAADISKISRHCFPVPVAGSGDFGSWRTCGQPSYPGGRVGLRVIADRRDN
jgi:hypothetical protein